jgi:hypothetical protein
LDRGNYNVQVPKILVLGESHYGEQVNYTPEWTRGVVKAWALGEEGTTRYFTTIAKILSGKAYERISQEEKKTIWQQVAFYNYVQRFVDEKTVKRPTEKMWVEAEEPFQKVMDSLKPDIVIVAGKELGGHVYKFEGSYAGNSVFCYWNHPSRGFKKDEAVKAFEEAKTNYAC